MIKLKEIIGYPSLKYHLDNGLSLHEHVYRYSSDSFVKLFAEAREAYENEEIELLNEDNETESISFRSTSAHKPI